MLTTAAVNIATVSFLAGYVFAHVVARTRQSRLTSLVTSRNVEFKNPETKSWKSKWGPLSSRQFSLFGRQILCPSVGIEGQRRICDSNILVVGAGGLGASALLYLAAAGVGKITIMDFDKVEASNLHRQVIHDLNHVGKPKVLSAAHKMKAINSEIEVIPLLEKFTFERGTKFLKENLDIAAILDCSDNLPTRLAISDVVSSSSTKNIPVVCGSALQVHGQLFVYNGREGCYRCLLNEQPSKKPNPVQVTPKIDDDDDYEKAKFCSHLERELKTNYALPPTGSCGENGVLGPVPGVIGTLMALETLRLIISGERPLRFLTFYDFDKGKWTQFQLKKNTNCDFCKMTATINLADYEQTCAAAHAPILPQDWSVNWKQLRAMQEHTRVSLCDVRPANQSAIHSLEGASIWPATDVDETLRRILQRLASGESVKIVEDELKNTPLGSTEKAPLVLGVFCTAGNASRSAVARLRKAQELFLRLPSADLEGLPLMRSFLNLKIVNVLGGLNALE